MSVRRSLSAALIFVIFSTFPVRAEEQSDVFRLDYTSIPKISIQKQMLEVVGCYSGPFDDEATQAYGDAVICWAKITRDRPGSEDDNMNWTEFSLLSKTSWQIYIQREIFQGIDTVNGSINLVIAKECKSAIGIDSGLASAVHVYFVSGAIDEKWETYCEHAAAYAGRFAFEDAKWVIEYEIDTNGVLLNEAFASGFKDAELRSVTWKTLSDWGDLSRYLMNFPSYWQSSYPQTSVFAGGERTFLSATERVGDIPDLDMIAPVFAATVDEWNRTVAFPAATPEKPEVSEACRRQVVSYLQYCSFDPFFNDVACGGVHWSRTRCPGFSNTWCDPKTGVSYDNVDDGVAALCR
ncbi:MAG: hypothetical protein KDK08_23100 [Rhizobiaceae bacterium]|nr:hypothetical protein [Rhizobiaceae bacterium]